MSNIQKFEIPQEFQEKIKTKGLEWAVAGAVGIKKPDNRYGNGNAVKIKEVFIDDYNGYKQIKFKVDVPTNWDMTEWEEKTLSMDSMDYYMPLSEPLETIMDIARKSFTGEIDLSVFEDKTESLSDETASRLAETINDAGWGEVKEVLNSVEE